MYLIFYKGEKEWEGGKKKEKERLVCQSVNEIKSTHLASDSKCPGIGTLFVGHVDSKIRIDMQFYIIQIVDKLKWVVKRITISNPKFRCST